VILSHLYSRGIDEIYHPGEICKNTQFVAVDMPQVDNLTIHILAAVAEQEAKLISERTKAALTAKREANGEWRVSNLDDKARMRGGDTMRQQAVDAYQGVKFTAGLLRAGGASYAKIAEQLNENGYRTRQGKQFKSMTIKRILDRADCEKVKGE
jgi:DNA invertase Pin-like site-specific DNA recombinase